MNKKFFLILALVLAMVLCLCACTTGSGDNTEGTTEPSTTTKPSESTEPSTEPTDDGKVVYTVIVKDSEGNPVVGEYVQICKEGANCFFPVATDENGAATWRLEEATDYYGSVTSDVEGASKVYFQDKFEVTLVWDAAE